MATQLWERPVKWLRRLFRRRSTPSRPWTVTLAWVEGQNFGRISVLIRLRAELASHPEVLP